MIYLQARQLWQICSALLPKRNLLSKEGKKSNSFRSDRILFRRVLVWKNVERKSPNIYSLIRMAENLSHVVSRAINSFGAKFQAICVVCLFVFVRFCFFTGNKLSIGKKLICKVKLNVKQRRSWWDGSLWAVSSGSTLFAKAYYYRLWQWKS